MKNLLFASSLFLFPLLPDYSAYSSPLSGLYGQFNFTTSIQLNGANCGFNFISLGDDPILGPNGNCNNHRDILFVGTLPNLDTTSSPDDIIVNAFGSSPGPLGPVMLIPTPGFSRDAEIGELGYFLVSSGNTGTFSLVNEFNPLLGPGIPGSNNGVGEIRNFDRSNLPSGLDPNTAFIAVKLDYNLDSFLDTLFFSIDQFDLVSESSDFITNEPGVLVGSPGTYSFKGYGYAAVYDGLNNNLLAKQKYFADANVTGLFNKKDPITGDYLNITNIGPQSLSFTANIPEVPENTPSPVFWFLIPGFSLLAMNKN
jgi:hypothetical protein